jgi:mortality factor 4-like protein 1
MQEQDQQQATKEEKTAKFTKAYFKKELELRKEDLQGKRKQSHAEKLVLPFSLKKVLVEEWEVIQCGMIPSLPVERAITVRQVLDNYLESKIGKFASSDDAVEKVEDASKDQETTGVKMEASETSKSEEEPPVDAGVEKAQSQRKKDPEKDELTKKQDQEWKEMVEGIALLFDQAIDARLLYRQELPLREWILQHDDLGKRRYCQVFGCEHLLRLFIRLPALLADQLSDAESRPILSKLNDFVRYLQKHQDRIFLQSYQHPPREEPAPRKRPAEGTAATKRGGAKRGRKASAKEVISKDATTNDDMETKVAASLSVGES